MKKKKAEIQGEVQPPSRQTAGDQAEAALFDAIMNGVIPPGSPLRLHDLASQLGMSIMPVRDALRRLEAHGLVEIVPHKGAWVPPLTLADLYDTYFTRIHLECLAIWTAALNFDEQQAAKSRAALDETNAARKRSDIVAARDAHERFHLSMYEASGSSWLVRSIGPAWRNSERYRVESMRNARHLKMRATEHEEMLVALIDHDGPRAVHLLALHLKTSVDLVAKGLREEGAEEADGMTAMPGVEELLEGRLSPIES